MASKYKVGLALGSGGVRGMAHFGVIRTLMKYGIKLSCVAGVSSGSVIGAALAAGKLDVLEDFFRRINWWTMFRMFFEFSWPWNGGYLTGKRVKDELRKKFGDIRFEDCEIPFTAIALDMMNGQEYPISSGDLVDGVFASLAVQGLFKPVAHDGHWIGDGGLGNPLPIEYCRKMGADYVIAVDVNLGQPLQAEYDEKKTPSLWTIFTQTCRIVENNWTDRILRTNPPDVLLQPDLHDIFAARLRHVTRAILRGKIAAERWIDSLTPEMRMRLLP
ncbi:MAG: patatin-like phospholipase family protein [Kiritimatiellae bacterium]|nr:patatin-like phospholipase family protein [Kiritimatiellia bacterium]